MKRSVLLFFILTALTIRIFAQSNLVVHRFTLSNGLQVWLHEDHNKPEIFGCVVVNGGAKLDEAHATGMAHYLEHMLFKGTRELGTTDYEKEKVYLDKIDSLYEELGETTDPEKRKALQAAINQQSIKAAEYAVANELNSLLTSIGGRSINAFTTHDMVVYYNFFPSHQIEKWLELYSHRFINPVFRMFQAELETVYEEKNREIDGMGSKLFNDYNKAFYKNHPYGQRNVLGEVEHLKNPSLITMYNYFNTWYVPNNMALILSGDFNTGEIKPLIEQKFSAWQYRELPPKKVYEEKDFNGKEIIRGRYLPVKVGFVGYRTVPLGHADEPVLRVINELLSNDNQTGLWDKLSLDNKLMFAGMESDMQVDYGRTQLFFVPKIIGQSLKKAERLVMNELEKIKKGEFDEDFLESVKKNLVRTIQLDYEENFDKALLMAEAFVSGRSWEDILERERKIAAVTREDIIRIANRYFGENRLVLYSRMGFPKKTKLDKPPFAPVVAKGKSSAYAENFRKIPDSEPRPKFVDVDKEVEVVQVSPLITIYKEANPVNDIFSLDIQYGQGRLSDSRLSILASMLAYAGTDKRTRDDLKTAFSRLGTTYSFIARDLHFIVRLQGFDDKLEESLKLTGELLDHPVFNKKGKKNALSSERFDRRISDKNVDFKDMMLAEYQVYGEHSAYLKRMSLKDMKKLSFDELRQALDKTRGYEINIFYTGNRSTEEIKQWVEKYLTGIPPTQERKKDARPIRKMESPELLFMHDKKAVQSQINFFVNSGVSRDNNKQPELDAFNQYFGSGMSGLVFQEIREFRSLAYATSARLYNGSVSGNPAHLTAYIGCQGDKTVEAIQVMDSLMRYMPHKPERIQDIKKSLTQAAALARPPMRRLGVSVYNWREQGYSKDPNAIWFERYPQLTFDHIVSTWITYIKDKPVSYAVLGDKKRMNLDDLKRYGSIREMKLSDIRIK